MNANSTSRSKMCPIWNHKCYSEQCQAWDEMGCKIINSKIMESKIFIPVITRNPYPFYKPSSTANPTGQL